jgi:hypothetical protein
MPKININGITREMTQAEEAAYIAEYERMAAEITPQPEPIEDRLAELEAALNLLLSGETE